MQKRNILWWMILFLMVFVAFPLADINIAIVSMTTNTISTNSTKLNDVICPNTSFYWNDDGGNKLLKLNQAELYNWNEREKNMVLGGFSYLSSISGFAGGYLSQKYGAKIILGYSQLIALLLSSLIPILAPYGPLAVTCVRVFQGVFTGIAVPGAWVGIVSKWCPPLERGKFFSLFLIGTTLGASISNFAFGFIAEYMHWKYIFYISSLCGLIWFSLWHFLIYETPEDHPTITRKEKEYITSTLRGSLTKEKILIPWKAILTSVPFIVCIFGSAGFICHLIILTTYMPSYLKSIYGMNSNQIGISISLAMFMSGLSGYGMALISDIIIKKEWLSMTAVRKLNTIIASAGASITLIIISYTECNIYLVVVMFSISVILRNFSFSGVSLVVVDLSPKFCDILNGVSSFFSLLMSVVLLALITYLSDSMDVEKWWKIVFLMTAILNIIFSLLYIVYGTSKIQPWNFSAMSHLKENHETVPLQKENIQNGK